MASQGAVTRGRQKSATTTDGGDHDNSFQQILEKLDENKKSSDSQYNKLLSEIHKISSRLSIIEEEHTGFKTYLEFLNQEVEDMKSEVNILKQTIHDMQQQNQRSEEKVTNSVQQLETDKNIKGPSYC